MLVFVLACITLCPCFAIILNRKRELVASNLLSFQCLVTINVLWLFLKVPWVGLQFVMVVFPDHTHFLLVHSFMHISLIACIPMSLPYSVAG